MRAPISSKFTWTLPTLFLTCPTPMVELRLWLNHHLTPVFLAYWLLWMIVPFCLAIELL